ncbi:MAG TPA: branched-chain amino acid ABC transporter permease [Paracoccaceae bacterium]|nr:branched-chain amino acid ABC transporter permease [Paracoccaceae bacterium]
MELDALIRCLSSPACAVTQVSTGLIGGMLLFLVASGLSLIFGVLGIINFAHGAFYMLGAYFALTGYLLTQSFLVAVVFGTLGMALFGALFERLLIKHIYGRDVLMQLLLCYGVVLILDDLVKIIWGAAYQSMGMPKFFARPPIFVLGGPLPPYYIFMVGLAVLVGAVLWFGLARTRFGKTVRAAAVNPQMVSALGINTAVLYASVFAIGGALAGLAGALAAPVRTMTPGMGLSVLIESFIVTVIGGMGSIVGAFMAALIIGLTRAFGAIGFPLFVDGAMFIMMALVLVLKPSGLFGKEV